MTLEDPSLFRRALGRVGRAVHPRHAPVEIEVDEALVRRLLAEQFPSWAELPLRDGPRTGTVNALYRLGDDLVVRVPRSEAGLGATDRETDWLPHLAPHLPVAVPEVLGRGRPTSECPLPWLVTRWLPGESPTPGRLGSPEVLAADLARFVVSLRGIGTDGAPPSWRGGLAVQSYDADVRRSIHGVAGLDRGAAGEAWEVALRAPPWDGRPVWLHADLWAGNVLAAGNRLTAVLDWATSGTGDPAYDLACAWTLLPVEARAVFRDAVSVDEATWDRGRGLAFAIWMISLHHFTSLQAEIEAQARYAVEQLLADFGAEP